MFRVPVAYSGYGSTEAGGLTHIWPWRAGDRCLHPEGMSRYGGASRPDIDWDLSQDGEILLRGRGPHVLASGYRTAGGLVPLTDGEGWFHSGDLGRRDEEGNLVFIERLADSIRVKGEYLPIAFVEETFGQIEGLEELALWRQDSELVDHVPVLYVVAPHGIPRDREPSKGLAPLHAPSERGAGRRSAAE